MASQRKAAVTTVAAEVDNIADPALILNIQNDADRH